MHPGCNQKRWGGKQQGARAAPLKPGPGSLGDTAPSLLWVVLLSPHACQGT